MEIAIYVQYVHVCVCVYIYTHTQMNVCVYTVYLSIYVYLHVCIHTHTHSYGSCFILKAAVDIQNIVPKNVCVLWSYILEPTSPILSFIFYFHFKAITNTDSQ